MSFNFEWPEFSPEFYDSAKEILAQALNKGETPPIIADQIEVKELDMGTIPPELEILEIGDLSTDRFRGIFRLSYSGDAYIVLQTKVQANPLNVPRPALDILGTPRILFAAAPLVVPMTLRLSNLSLRAIVVLVVSRQKGITLVFKNDPLEAVNVSSSFDGVESVAGYIQREIEAQLREAFRSDLPSVIHRLSQKWLSGEVKTASEGAAMPGSKTRGMPNGFSKEAKIETRTTVGTGEKMRTRALTTRLGDLGLDVDAAESVEYRSEGGTTSYTILGGRDGHSEMRRALEGRGDRTMGMQRRRPKGPSRSSSFAPSSASILDVLDSVPESIENYDPTYGLRPESAPSNTGFANYERVVRTGASGRGLGDVLDEEGEEDADSLDFELVGMPDLDGDSDAKWGTGSSHLALERYRHTEYDDEDDDGLEFDGLDPDHPRHRYETIPAVGGGTITRPRVFHTQSQMRTRTYSQGSLTAHGSPSTTAATARARLGRVSTESIASDPFRSPPDHPSHGGGVLETLRLHGAGTASIAGASSARFPFPNLSSSMSAGNRQRAQSSLPRSSSVPNVRRGAFQTHRSAWSSQLSMSGMATRGPSSVASGYSSPPSSIRSPIMTGDGPDEQEEEALVYPPTRPTPIDLLSCSPSSILNDSYDDDLPITLNPSNNEQCGHLATLNHSNYTLSPFTRNHEHFTARSTPYGNVRGKAEVGKLTTLGEAGTSMIPIGISREGTLGAPIKAKRKRIHRIGAAAAVGSEPSMSSGMSSGAGSNESWSRAKVSPPMMGERGMRSLNGSVSERRWAGDGMMTSGLGSSVGRMGIGRAPSVGRMGVGRAPSELSDYFPSMPDLGRRSGAVRR